MTPDPKWLEILKASGWQTTAIALACAIIIALVSNEVLPTPEGWIIFSVASIGIVTGCLAAASILSALTRFFGLGSAIKEWRWQKKARNSVSAYIPFMNEQERSIIAHLLHHNQKTFTGDIDGGNATTLIARGIIVSALKPGQVFQQLDAPFAVPDVVWDVLIKHKEKFPYQPTERGVLPWREDNGW